MSSSYYYGSPDSREYGGSTYGSDGSYCPPDRGYIQTGPGPVRRGYPPIHVPPVKPYPADPYIDQFTLSEALMAGTLFRWLYDPYEKGWQPVLRS